MNHGKQVREAMGEENAKKMEQFGCEGIISDESNIFAFSPKMSYPADQTIPSDPSFWRPKTATSGEKEGGQATAPAKKTPGKQPPKQ